MPTEITGPIEHGVLAERHHYEGAVDTYPSEADFLDSALAEQRDKAGEAVREAAEVTEIANAAALSARVVNVRREHIRG